MKAQSMNLFALSSNSDFGGPMPLYIAVSTTSGERRISSVRTLYEELYSIGLERRANTGVDDLYPVFEEFPLSGSSNLERNGLNIG